MTPNFSAVDDAWKKEFSINYQLNLLIGIDFLQYCILDIPKNKYISVGGFNFTGNKTYSGLCKNIRNIFADYEIFAANYHFVSVAVVNETSTLVPLEFYSEDSVNSYFRFNHAQSASDKILTDDILSIQAKNIYAVNQELVALLNEKFGNIQIRHGSSSLISTLLKENNIYNNPRIFANITGNKVELIVTQKEKLIFNNSFTFRSPEDFIYFVLFVCEQLKLNPDSVDFYFLGEIEKKSSLYDITYKYIRNINFGRRPNNYSYSYKFAFFPSHFYFNAFAMQK